MTWLEALHGDLTPYRCLPFWSWNDELEEAELIRQIRQMKQAGMGGFFMHARSGLKTEYMSEDWFRAVETAAQEAQKLGMNAWCYDENGWPSGFAGMKLLKDPANWAHYLIYAEKETFDGKALAVYVLEENCLQRVYGPLPGQTVYHTVYEHTNSSVVDILNPHIVRLFLDETHEKYKERLSSFAGHLIRGFFTDEPQYYRWDTAYTPLLPALYREAYGEELLDVLGALFVDCTQAYPLRFRYWRLMNKQFAESFGRQVYEWCNSHDLCLTGHAIEEQCLSSQMWCCAGVMPFYEYEHIPGCDWLGREISTEMTPRQVSSAAQQLGKKQVLTESFACTGWDVTPAELKRILEWQYVNGVNLLSAHLFPYSIAGHRKTDHPAFFSDCLPWFEELKPTLEYFARLGCLLTESEEVVHVGVIHPMHSAYLDYNRRQDYASIQPLEEHFASLVEKLGAAGIGHHYIDETLLEKYGRVEGASLVVGRCRYEAIVIPSMKGLDASTVRLLEAYCQGGGRLYLAGDRPRYVDGQEAALSFLQSNCHWEDLVDPAISIAEPDTEIRFTFRRSPRGDFLFAVNLSKSREYAVTYRVCAKDAVRLDLEAGMQRPIPYSRTPEGITFPLALKPGESAVILLNQGVAPADAPKPPANTRQWDALTAEVTAADENSLVLDYARLSMDGTTYGETLPIAAVSDQLLRAEENRTVYLQYAFTVQELPRTLFLETEYTAADAIWVNGQAVSLSLPGTLHRACGRCDILPFTKVGENVVVVKLAYYQKPQVYDVLFHTPDVTESLINCLVYDTTVEALYLRGDFGVFVPDGFRAEGPRISLANGPFILGKRPDKVRLAHLERQGYLFFAGKITLRITPPFPMHTGGCLRLKGRYAAARLSANGGAAHSLLFQDSCRIEPSGEIPQDALTITLISGNRNLYGPFHVKRSPEPPVVFPGHFDMAGTWRDGRSPVYTDRYAFVSFGVDAVEWTAQEEGVQKQTETKGEKTIQ